MKRLAVIIYIVLAAIILRFGVRLYGRFRRSRSTATAAESKRPPRKLTPWQRKIFTVWVFFIVSLKRVFRDRVALFFTFLFPLIFLFVFGGIFGNNTSVSFH